MPNMKTGFRTSLIFIFCSCFAFFLSCDLNLGSQPVGPTVTTDDPDQIDNTGVPIDSITDQMQISVSPSVLKASSTDMSAITVTVFDKRHNPVSGQKVQFSARKGFISNIDSITDSEGRAYASYRAIRMNTLDTVFATMEIGDSIQAVGQTVTLEGLEVLIAPTSTNALVNTTIPVKITVRDGRGEPVPDANITLSGTTQTQGKTSGNGVFATSVTSSTQLLKTIIASSLGSSDTVSVAFWSQIPDTVTAVPTKNLRLRIFSSKTQMRADNSDSSIITAWLVNETNNPQPGQQVRFTSSLGVITQYATIDSIGRASVVLRSSPVNGVCTVSVSAVGLNLSAQKTQILFSGVNLKISTSATDLKTGQFATIEALVKDGSGNPINGDSVVFLATGGVFGNGSAIYSTSLDPNGKAVAQVTASTAGTVTINAQALNTSDAIEIRFTTNTLTLSSSPSSITVGGSETSTITATYVNGSGNPVSNALLVFATNAGVLSDDSVYTNTNGTASVSLSAGTFAGKATVQAVAANGTATTTVTFTAAKAAKISLAVSPDNIGVNGGVAVLTATVTDAQGNMVSGANVNFRILKGPGGGEYINNPLVVTNEGTASSRLFAGSQPSQYRATEVVASVGDVADTSKLTISGEPHIITVSRPEDDTVNVPKGGLMDQTTFDFFIGAVVQDINGNPVADGTEVHFSAFVSGMAVGRLEFDRWSGIGSVDEVKAILRYAMIDVPFEDINNNLQMDPSIDLKLNGNDAIASRGDDKNGDGVCDYNTDDYDFFYDFNGNGVCDTFSQTFNGEPYYDLSMKVTLEGDTTYEVYADLNLNGRWDRYELAIDHNGNGFCDLPPSGDFRYRLWEMRKWYQDLNFDHNEFAVVIAKSEVTKGGVAYAKITYPRQFARRLYSTVNAEANGIRDRDGERFLLPVVREQ